LNRARPPLILVVDDFADNLEMYVQYLEFTGYRTITATDGIEAIDKAMTDRPDLIVMDLSLPRMDGWEATRRLKADPRTKQIPVIALTGHALEGQSKAAEAAGCDGYLTKPCLPEALEAEIGRRLASRRRKRERRR
jgi:CheY-like chemotaxis protein